MFFGDDAGLELCSCLSRACTARLRISPMSTSARRRWPCSSRSTSSSAARSSRPDALDDALGDHRDAVPLAEALALDDRADQRVDDRSLKRTPVVPNSSGISVSVAPAALPMPSARWPALRPIDTTMYHLRRRVRVDHQVLDDLGADVARGLEAEGVDVGRQVEIVVDRLRHVHDADPAGRLRSSSFIAEKAVSSPPMVMSCATSRRSSVRDGGLEQLPDRWSDWRARCR